MPKPEPPVQLTGLEPPGATEAMGYVHGAGWRTFPQIEEMAADDNSPLWDNPDDPVNKKEVAPPPPPPPT